MPGHGGHHGGPGGHGGHHRGPGFGGGHPMGGGHHHHPMGGGMWHRPPRNRGCCGCLFPVIGVIGMLIAVFAFII